MKILETTRTILREMTTDDAGFMIDLLNQPSFIKYIGDRNVRSVEQAREYIETRLAASYEKFGYGLWLVELKSDQTPIGINGFVRRDTLPDADIGFAFLSRFEKKGYAFETAQAVMDYGKKVLNLKKVLAITSQNNDSSGKLLEKLGFSFDGLLKSPHDDDDLKLFSATF